MVPCKLNEPQTNFYLNYRKLHAKNDSLTLKIVEVFGDGWLHHDLTYVEKTKNYFYRRLVKSIVLRPNSILSNYYSKHVIENLQQESYLISAINEDDIVLF